MRKLGLFFLLILPAAAFYFWPSDQGEALSSSPDKGAMVVSLSSDGRYAVSSHLDKRLVLWDLQRREKVVVFENVNVYSAFFVPTKDVFIWQDLSGYVHFYGIDGKEIKSFHHFSTYGHLVTPDLENYISCDLNWNIYLGYGDSLIPMKKDGNSPNFFTGKLLNMSLTRDGRYLLTAGDSGLGYSDDLPIQNISSVNPQQISSNYGGVFLWNLSARKPQMQFPGHVVKTTAILSPDAEYVVSGDENGRGFVRTAYTGKTHVRLASLHHGVLNKNGSNDYEKWTYDKTGLIPTPSDLESNEAILAFRFIGPQHYLRFLTYSPYAVLYHIDNPLPLKYLPLGREPFPATSDYSRNAAMDTAPEAGILVMGQRDGGGIIMYKYDSVKMKLEKIWVAD